MNPNAEKPIVETPKPKRLDRVLMWFIRNIPRVNKIVQYGLNEAYDVGVQTGFQEGAKVNGKSSARKARRAIRDVYKSIKEIPKA